MDGRLKYHHLSIPISSKIEGEIYLKDFKCFQSGLETSEFGIELMRYEKESTLPEILKTKPHIAFEVPNISEFIKNKKVIVAPRSLPQGRTVAFIEESNIPIELIQIKE